MMPTDKTKNFLKGFGEAAPALAGQLQSAVSRTSRASGDFDISDGEPVEFTTTAAGTVSMPNPLGRTPIGGFVINVPDDDAREFAVSVSDDEIRFTHEGAPGTFTVWVF